MKYAQNTTVSSDRSRAEIEKILGRYGASSFAYGWQFSTALIAFQYNEKQIKFTLQLPDRNDKSITRTPTGQARTKAAQETAYEQAVRQKWRALLLVIKAKLEAVESGISIFEDEFMANIVLPNGQTISEYIMPQLEQVYLNNSMPLLLPMLSNQKEKSIC